MIAMYNWAFEEKSVVVNPYFKEGHELCGLDP